MEEILSALKVISDNSALCIEVYGAKFFKITWNITKKEDIKVVKDYFFEKEKLYRAINKT